MQFDLALGYTPWTRKDPSLGGLIATRTAETGRGSAAGDPDAIEVGADVEGDPLLEVHAAAITTRAMANAHPLLTPPPWTSLIAVASAPGLLP